LFGLRFRPRDKSHSKDETIIVRQAGIQTRLPPFCAGRGRLSSPIPRAGTFFYSSCCPLGEGPRTRGSHDCESDSSGPWASGGGGGEGQISHDGPPRARPLSCQRCLCLCLCLNPLYRHPGAEPARRRGRCLPSPSRPGF
jgi:hypothetical protein